jgi:hypothetical protein
VKKPTLVVAMLLMVLAFTGAALAYVPYNSIWGTQDSETLYGTSGNDWIYTMSGEDTVYAGEGDDSISTRDGADPYGGTGGADLVYCGPGFDSVDADLSDVLAEDCEPPTLTAAAGILENPGATPEGFGPYAMTDEASGVYYVLEGGSWLDDFVGQRVIAYGRLRDGYDPPVLSLETLHHPTTTDEQPDPDLLRYGSCTAALQLEAPDAYTQYCTATVYQDAPPSE